MCKVTAAGELRKLRAVFTKLSNNTLNIYRVSQKKMWFAAPGAKLFFFCVQLSCMVFIQYFLKNSYFPLVLQWHKKKSANFLFWKKRFADFLLGHWSTKKNYKKNPYRRIALKKYNFSVVIFTNNNNTPTFSLMCSVPSPGPRTSENSSRVSCSLIYNFLNLCLYFIYYIHKRWFETLYFCKVQSYSPHSHLFPTVLFLEVLKKNFIRFFFYEQF